MIVLEGFEHWGGLALDAYIACAEQKKNKSIPHSVYVLSRDPKGTATATVGR